MKAFGDLGMPETQITEPDHQRTSRKGDSHLRLFYTEVKLTQQIQARRKIHVLWTQPLQGNQRGGSSLFEGLRKFVITLKHDRLDIMLVPLLIHTDMYRLGGITVSYAIFIISIRHFRFQCLKNLKGFKISLFTDET